MAQIIPGILEKDWSEIEKKIEKARLFTNNIHIDLMDGKFSPNTTFLDPSPFAKYAKEINFEAHLMVDNPLQYLESFARIGFKRFIGHVEKMPDITEFVARGELLGEVGLALDLETEIDSLDIDLEDLDSVLIMGIHAGASGQVFLPQVLEKIKKARQKSETLVIEVDGGINDQNILDIKNAGANRFIATSFIFNSQSPGQEFRKLSDLIKED